MNLKKMLSVMAATAIGVTSLSLVSVSAKSIDNAQVGMIYKAGDLGGTGSLPDFFNPNQETAYNSIGAPFGEYSELAKNYTKMITEDEFKKADNTYSLTYNIETGGNYTFYVLTPEYNERYTDIYLNNDRIFNGHVKTSDATTAGNMTVIDNDGSKDTRQYGIIHVTKELSTGINKFEFKLNTKNRFIGIVAVALIKNAEPEVEQSKDWTNLSGALTNTTVVDNEEEGGYIFTYPKNTGGSGFSYDLLKVLENKPEKLSTATGKIKVSYELYMDRDHEEQDNSFIDLSGTQKIHNHWNGTGENTYGRLSSGLTNGMRIVAGQGATNGDKKVCFTTTTKYGEWVKVEYIADLTKGTFTGKYGNATSPELTGTATERTDALYLNVQPSQSANEYHDVVYKIKNISAEYIEDTVDPQGTLQYEGASTEAEGDKAYGYTYSIETTETTKFNGCNWTVDCKAGKQSPTSNFAEVSGGITVTTGLIITTDVEVENPEEYFDVSAEFVYSE